MSDSLLREGGPNRVRRLSDEQYEMSISIPVDADGLLGRECTDTRCSPGYFKVKTGTGLPGGQEASFCPYCRTSAPPREFTTREQVRYARDIATAEAVRGLEGMLARALSLDSSGRRQIDGGLVSIELSMQKPAERPVFRPFEEELRRDLRCPDCGLDHAVFGLATWCPDCGADIFLTHVEAEIAVIRRMLDCVDSRRKELGPRVAARDIENALEDAVSVFEAVLKAITRRYLAGKGIPSDEIEASLDRIRNAYQNLSRAAKTFKAFTSEDLYQGIGTESLSDLAEVFAKRHTITHNLGVVDRRYLRRALAGHLRGREVRVSVAEVQDALDLVSRIVSSAYARSFRPAMVEPEV